MICYGMRIPIYYKSIIIKDFYVKSKVYTQEVFDEIKQIVENEIGAGAKVTLVRSHNLIHTLVTGDGLDFEDEIEK